MYALRLAVSRIAAAVVALILFAASPGRAALEQGQVLLLYNSQNATSLAIRNAYIAKYPGVLQFDINIAYPTLAPNDPQFSTPPEPSRMNNQFITRKMFDEVFFNFTIEAITNYQTFLAENPQIRAIATTRGLPAGVDDNFNPSPGGPWNTRSFESLLAAKRSATTGAVPNPYYGWDIDFASFLEVCGGLGPNGYPPGQMYLVCRLDAGVSDAQTEEAFRDATIAMIQRSGSMGVNTFAVSSITDGFNGHFLSPSDFPVLVYRLWASGWCVFHETTSLFVHGPTDPMATAADAAFWEWPALAFATFGHNHSHHPDAPPGGEPSSNQYVSFYEPSPSGFFYSIDSFNGWTLHSPGDDRPFGQCAAADWIGAGGGFAVCYVTEPGGTDARFFNPALSMTALYTLGLTFAESIYVGMPFLAQRSTAIGDPLARVVPFIPDVDGNRIVDGIDLALVQQQVGQPGPFCDVNRDGTVNELDIALVVEVFGRDCSTSPTVPASPWLYPWNAVPGTMINPFGPNNYYIYLSRTRCHGDTTGEGCINSLDLSNVLGAIGSLCPEMDFNKDGLCNQSDLDIVTIGLGTF